MGRSYPSEKKVRTSDVIKFVKHHVIYHFVYLDGCLWQQT